MAGSPALPPPTLVPQSLFCRQKNNGPSALMTGPSSWERSNRRAWWGEYRFGTTSAGIRTCSAPFVCNESSRGTFSGGLSRLRIETGRHGSASASVASEHHDRFSEDVSESGLKNLDDLLEGGLSAGTTTLLIGPAGVGKSTTAMQYVVAALKPEAKGGGLRFDECWAL